MSAVPLVSPFRPSINLAHSARTSTAPASALHLHPRTQHLVIDDEVVREPSTGLIGCGLGLWLSSPNQSEMVYQKGDCFHMPTLLAGELHTCHDVCSSLHLSILKRSIVFAIQTMLVCSSYKQADGSRKRWRERVSTQS